MVNTDFKTKSQPTTAMSNFEGSTNDHTHMYPLTTPIIADLPPPKPKRPTRDILDRLKC